MPSRSFVLGLRNIGLGIAKFPSIRFNRACGLTADRFGIDGNGGFGLMPRPSDNEWVAYRGGLDEVIYPEETRKITKLQQNGENTGHAKDVIVGGRLEGLNRWVFRAVNFSCEISCEGLPTVRVERSISEDSIAD